MTFNSKEDVLGIEIYIIKDQSIYESLEKDKEEIELRNFPSVILL